MYTISDLFFISLVDDGKLTVSTDGIAYNTKTKRYIGATGSGRYPKISYADYSSGTKVIRHMQIHRLVWMLFNGEIPEGILIGHIDDNKENRCLDNLELVTPKENTDHYRSSGAELQEWKVGNTEWMKTAHYRRKNG